MTPTHYQPLRLVLLSLLFAYTSTLMCTAHADLIFSARRNDNCSAIISHNETFAASSSSVNRTIIIPTLQFQQLFLVRVSTYTENAASAKELSNSSIDVIPSVSDLETRVSAKLDASVTSLRVEYLMRAYAMRMSASFADPVIPSYLNVMRFRLGSNITGTLSLTFSTNDSAAIMFNDSALSGITNNLSSISITSTEQQNVGHEVYAFEAPSELCPNKIQYFDHDTPIWAPVTITLVSIVAVVVFAFCVFGSCGSQHASVNQHPPMPVTTASETYSLTRHSARTPSSRVTSRQAITGENEPL